MEHHHQKQQKVVTLMHSFHSSFTLGLSKNFAKPATVLNAFINWISALCGALKLLCFLRKTQVNLPAWALFH